VVGVAAPDAARSDASWALPAVDRQLVGPVAVAIILSAVAMVLGWRGGDLAAQVYRVNLFRAHGLVPWDDLWFAGHATFDYSALSPIFGALAGPVALGAASSVVSAWCVERLLRAQFGASATLGALWFATSTVTNLAVGRITFSFGVAIGLGALVALQRGRLRWCAALAVGCSLASPVAAAFLCIGIVAWGSAHRSRWWAAAGIVGAAALPIVAIAVAFPGGGGVFPFETWALGWNLATTAAVFLALPSDQVVLRRAAVLYALANVAVYAVPNPLGGNISRLAQYAVGPLLACLLVRTRPRLLALVAIPLLVWQWLPALDGITQAKHDPSTASAFYDPLLTALRSQPVAGPIRIEIPMTLHHWEAVYVAANHALARGWETQLDRGYNPIFYDGSLDANTYERWLADQGVTYVALPAVPLDPTSRAEAALLRTRLPYLTPVWHNASWQLWRDDTSPGLVSGPATLTKLGPDSFTVNVTSPGDVMVRVRTSGHWAVDSPGCVAEDSTGWIVLRDLPVGSHTVGQALRSTKCKT
jgi:hypothetical protein